MGLAWCDEQEPCLSFNIADDYSGINEVPIWQGKYILEEKASGATKESDESILESIGGGFYREYLDLGWGI